MDTAKKYLLSAREDYKSSKLLYENNLYPQSVFYTGQSIEKVCKYIILKNEILNENELKKKIGHSSIKAHIIIIEYLINKITLSNFKEKYNVSEQEKISDFNKELIEGIKFLKELRDNCDVKKFDDKTLDNHLLKLDFFINCDFNLYEKYDFLFSSPENLLTHLVNLNILDDETLKILKIRYENPIERERVIIEVNKILTFLPKYQNYTQAIIILASILSKYCENTRYPDEKSHESPQEIFNGNQPLIARMTEFHEYIEEIITFLENSIL